MVECWEGIGKMEKSFYGYYLEALGINPRDKPALQSALKRAVETRCFEIELYWKRATYFWAFQAIAGGALSLLFKDGNIISPALLPIPCIIGIISALAALLTAKGSKFWQENWEMHVDMLENALNERVTQVILWKDDVQFSVSRVNEDLIKFVLYGWSIGLVISLANLFPFRFCPSYAWLLSDVNIPLVMLYILIPVIALFRLRSLKTKLSGHIIRSGNHGWQEYTEKKKNQAHTMLWRNPPCERVPTQNGEGPHTRE